MEQPAKLCAADKKSDAMEPKQTESEPEAQKSDVCNEINKSGAVEQPEKLCDEKGDTMEPKQNGSEPKAQKSDVCNEISKSDEVEQPEKLFETDKKSDTMEPKQNESETEEQKSDVRSEVCEPKPKQIETESVPNESENESIG